MRFKVKVHNNDLCKKAAFNHMQAICGFIPILLSPLCKWNCREAQKRKGSLSGGSVV